MNIITLSTRDGWHSGDLRRAAVARGHCATNCSWRELVGAVAADAAVARAGDVVLDDADAVLLRSMPAGSLEQIVFRMDLVQRLEAAGVTVLNRPRAIEAAVDKYLALARIRAANLPVPRTVACQRLGDAMDAFKQLGGDVVLKPLFGSEGFGITRLNDRALAQRAFAMLERMNSVLYLQQFIQHDGGDLRLMVLGGRVIAAMRRTNGDDWRTNVSLGGRGEAIAADAPLCDLAIRAAEACDAWLAGVDIIINAAGEPFVLEVNAVPGWRELSRVTNLDIADCVIEALETSIGSAHA